MGVQIILLVDIKLFMEQSPAQLNEPEPVRAQKNTWDVRSLVENLTIHASKCIQPSQLR